MASPHRSAQPAAPRLARARALAACALALALPPAGGCVADYDALRAGAATGSSAPDAGPAAAGPGGAGGGAGAGGATGGGGSGAGGGSGGTAAPGCGNGKPDPDEQCDDGNAAAKDGCDRCSIECNDALDMQDPTTKHCFHIFDTPRTWDDAQKACKDWRVGADLASITTTGEADLLMAGSRAWLGGKRDVNRVWHWVSGEAWGDEHWDELPPEPTNARGEDCLAYEQSANDWHDALCTEENWYVCEYPAL